MATVGSLSPYTGTQQSSAGNKAALDYNAFLNLLLAQLKNQDPTKPMDSTEYMSQLAAFSNVEQSVKMNAKLDDILTLQSLTQAETLIGKNVASKDDAVKGRVVSVAFTKDGPVATLDNGKTIGIGQIVKVAQ